MIEVLGYYKKNVNYEIEYNKSINVVNIETELMSDECIPHRESTGCMIWLDKDMLLGEMECISPTISEVDIHKENIEDGESGTPQLRINFEEKPIGLCITEDRLIIIFDNEKEIEKKSISSNIVFYLNDSKVIALECSSFKVVEE